MDEAEYFCGIALDPENEWVKLAKLIHWHQFEEEYATSFRSGTRQPAYSFRMAMGSLLIKERYQFPDGETVAHIIMNPYRQYFIGLEAFTQKSQFDASMMTKFRKRISTNTHRVDNRIVSLSQPWVRPIVRGKQIADVEFRAKVEMRDFNTFLRVEELIWGALNESTTFRDYVENY